MLLIHIAFNGEIIIPAPGWVSYEPQAEIGSNKVHWLETKRENNWFPTGKELEKKIKSIRKNKNIIFATAAAIVVMSLFGISKLQVENSFINYFTPFILFIWWSEFRI